MPLMLLFQARVFLAQLVHLALEVLNATLLLLQQLLLGLDDVVELLQVLGRLAGVFRGVLHVAVRETPVHGDRFVDAAARSRTGSVPIHRGALSSLGHCLRSLLLSLLRMKLRCSSAPSTGSAPQQLPSGKALRRWRNSFNPLTGGPLPASVLNVLSCITWLKFSNCVNRVALADLRFNSDTNYTCKVFIKSTSRLKA